MVAFSRIAIRPDTRSTLHKKAPGDDLSAALGLFLSGGLNVQGHVSADHRIISLALYNFARKRGVAYLR